MRALQRAQEGNMALVVTFILGALFFSFFVRFSERFTDAAAAQRDDAVHSQLSSLKDEILRDYRDQIGVVDGNATYTGYAGQAGVVSILQHPLSGSLVASMSNRLVDPVTGSFYRRIAVWEPYPNDSAGPPSFDVTSGTFVRCGATVGLDSAPTCANAYQVLIDTRALHQDAEAEAWRYLNDMATDATIFFAAKVQFDPAHSASTNYFRAPEGCGSVVSGEMPCIDTYEDLAVHPEVVDILRITPVNSMLNPWGLPYQVSNLADSNTAAPPYTMSFSTTTPWGLVMELKAVQPL